MPAGGAARGPLRAHLAPVADIAALAAEWRAFEGGARASFFQSWTWTGCLAGERFSDPFLLRVSDAGHDVALGLFNRRRFWGGRRFWLAEGGDPVGDAVFIEDNGLLLAESAVFQAREVIAAGLAAFGRKNLTLSGVDEAYRLAAGERFRLAATREAPFVDLARARSVAGGFLAGRSANTRYQLRRSQRSYAERGALTLERAADVGEAYGFLDALARLHQQSWIARGRPGAFANPFFLRFHRELIARGHPRGEIDLLRVSAGGKAFAYLYNFLWRGEVASYQSGFDFASALPHEKPGLTAHHLAIEHYAAQGWEKYDFLAGASRYKISLADGTRTLYWLTSGGMSWLAWRRCWRGWRWPRRET